MAAISRAVTARQFEAAEPELMDRHDASRAELDRALRSLRGLNRYFGSYALVRHFCRRWITRGARLRLLDLATGSGDIPRYVVDYARAIGAQVNLTALDFQPTTVAIARALSRRYPEITFLEANALTFEEAEQFDIVLCSLALHHFSNEDAVRLLQRAKDLSRRHVLIADIRRGFLLRTGVYLLTAFLFRDRMTREDGRASARRAFTFDELRALARRAGWENFGAREFRFARQAIWLE